MNYSLKNMSNLITTICLEAAFYFIFSFSFKSLCIIIFVINLNNTLLNYLLYFPSWIMLKTTLLGVKYVIKLIFILIF